MNKKFSIVAGLVAVIAIACTLLALSGEPVGGSVPTPTSTATPTVAPTPTPTPTPPQPPRMTFPAFPARLTIIASPAQGSGGTQVTVIGSGFTPYTAVTIKIGNYTSLQQPLTDSQGVFTTTFTVPSLEVQKVSACDGVLCVVLSGKGIASPTTASQLAGINAQLIRVWGYSNGTWYLYDPADPTGSNLATLTSGLDYWINVNAAVTLIYGGYTCPLGAGWNLIGWR